MRSEIVHVVTHESGYGNTIVDGREKDQWLKSNIDHYYQGFFRAELLKWVRMVGSSNMYVHGNKYSIIRIVTICVDVFAKVYRLRRVKDKVHSQFGTLTLICILKIPIYSEGYPSW